MEIRIDHHHHVHFEVNDDVVRKLNRIEEKLEKIITQELKLMALSKESLEMLKEIDADTTSTSARIDRLLANPNTNEAEFRAALQPISARLKLIAHDPADPVPPVDPELPPV